MPYRIEGLESLNQRFDSLERAQQDYLVPTMRTALNTIHSNIPNYPPPRRRKYPWKSRRQQIFVIIAIREGRIRVPYRRTGQLQRSIATDVEIINNTVAGVIGTNYRPAPWVISEEETDHGGPQAVYHQGNWWTLQNVVDESMPEVQRLFKRRLADFIGG